MKPCLECFVESSKGPHEDWCLLAQRHTARAIIAELLTISLESPAPNRMAAIEIRDKARAFLERTNATTSTK